MQQNTMNEKILTYFPEHKDWLLDRFSWDPNPKRCLRVFTELLIIENKLNIVVWTNFLNEIYNPEDEESHKTIEMILNTMYLSTTHGNYLKQHLMPELRKVYEGWELYHKESDRQENSVVCDLYDMKYLPLNRKILTYLPEYKDWFLERYDWDTSPMGYLEGFTMYLVDEGKFDVAIWTDFLNKIYSPEDEKISGGILFSIKVIYQEEKYVDYLKEHLRPELKKVYEYWEEYYKD
jgi:hypothetical protein